MGEQQIGNTELAQINKVLVETNSARSRDSALIVTDVMLTRRAKILSQENNQAELAASDNSIRNEVVGCVRSYAMEDAGLAGIRLNILHGMELINNFTPDIPVDDAAAFLQRVLPQMDALGIHDTRLAIHENDTGREIFRRFLEVYADNQSLVNRDHQARNGLIQSVNDLLSPQVDKMIDWNKFNDPAELGKALETVKQEQQRLREEQSNRRPSLRAAEDKAVDANLIKGPFGLAEKPSEDVSDTNT